eukprot:765230-Hanusia_phi.AAC.2
MRGKPRGILRRRNCSIPLFAPPSSPSCSLRCSSALPGMRLGGGERKFWSSTMSTLGGAATPVTSARLKKYLLTSSSVRKMLSSTCVALATMRQEVWSRRGNTRSRTWQSPRI